MIEQISKEVLQDFYKVTLQTADGLYTNSSDKFQNFQQYLLVLQQFITPVMQTEDDLWEHTVQIVNSLMDAYQQQNMIRMADLLKSEVTVLIEEQGMKSAYEIDWRSVRDELTDPHSTLDAASAAGVMSATDVSCSADVSCTANAHHVIGDWFQKNLDAIPEYKQSFYDSFAKIPELVDENDPDILIDPQGNIAVNRMIHGNQNWWYVNSIVDCNYAAEQWSVNLADITYNDKIFLCGMSNCEYIRTVLRHMTSENILVVYEPDLKVFAMNLMYTDLSDLLKRDNCILIVEGMNIDKLSDCLLSMINYNTMKYTRFYASPGYDVTYSAEIEQFMQRCTKAFENIQLQNNTIVLKSKNVNHNVIMNLKFIMQGSTINDLKKTFEQANILDMPVIIVAAGPSLDKNITYLRQAKNKALIIAVDSALRMLVKYDIMPDMIVTLDPDKERVLFSDDKVNDIPILYSVHATYDILDKNRSRKFVYSNMAFLNNMMYALGKEIGIVDSGGSVANAGFAVAEFLGFHTIIMIGQDLALTGNKKHASVVYEEKELSDDEKDFMTEVEGQDGTMLKTYINLKNYRDWYENKIEFNPNIHLVNATEGGALIHGATHMRLVEAIEQYCTKEIDFQKLILSTPLTFTDQEKEAYLEQVKQYRKDCEEFEWIASRCQKEYEAMARCRSEKQVKPVMDRIQSLTKQMEQFTIMEFISYYARQVENDAMTDLYDADQEKENALWKDIAQRGKAVAVSYQTYAKQTKELFAKSLKAIEEYQSR